MRRISELRRSQSIRTAGTPTSAIIFHSCRVTKLLPSLGTLLVTMMVLIWSPQNPQIDPQLVEGLDHIKGKVRELVDLDLFHFFPFLPNGFFRFLSLKSPRSASGITASGCTPRYLTTSSGVTKVSFIR